MQYTLKVKRKDYCYSALKIINCIYKLSELELKILTDIMNKNIKILDKESRASVREFVNTDKYTFNNYINKLKGKKLLIETSFGLSINPGLINSIADRNFEFTFEFTD